ncbi:MAG: hypothetical protein QXR42_08105 [Candidatus Bathyarchaeia archaeon]
MLSVVPVGTTDALLMFIGIFPYINYFGIIKVTGETVTLVLKTYYHTLEAAATEVPHNRKYEYLCTVPPNSDIKRF